MNAKFSKIALIGKYQSPDVAEAVLFVAAGLREAGLEVSVEQGTASAIGMIADFPVVTYDEIGTRAELAVVLGGDGTMLNSARRLAEYGVPLVGVNQGRLGFLTDVARESALPALLEISKGHYTEEARMMLDAQMLRGEALVFRSLIFNDVVINKGDLGRMIEFDLSVDGEYVYTQRSDGMIVSTPTGSTAYALSSNGPILHPRVSGIALVPMCPHALTARPVTVPDDCCIDLTLLAPHDARVHFDGHTRFDARAGDCLRVTRSPHRVRLLHPIGYSYYHMLREKLHWSSTPRYP